MLKTLKVSSSGFMKTKNTINTFFSKVFVLNMPHEEGELVKIDQHFKRVGISYEIFNAVNGRAARFDREWEAYNRRSELTYFEKAYRKKFIESRGAFGYLKTMKKLLLKAIELKLDSVMVFDNDCLFDHAFEAKFDEVVASISSKKWKLLLLGASDYGISERDLSSSFYQPVKFQTCGSFAVGIHHSCYQEIIAEIDKMETPFDNLPLGVIYENYPDECMVVYPNIVIADVRESAIRGARDMKEHSKKMKWKLENFNITS